MFTLRVSGLEARQGYAVGKSHRKPRGELRGAELNALTIKYPYSMER